MTRTALGTILLLTAAAAPMQALHDRDWYVSNGAVRSATLRACYADASYRELPDCLNAAMAEDVVRARRLLVKSNVLLDPKWWKTNDIARRGAATICMQPGNRAYPQYEPYCSMVFSASIQART